MRAYSYKPTIKVDLNKAYERCEWDFIQAILHQVQFPQLWPLFVLECITTVSYSILVSGLTSPTFGPFAGI